MKNVRGFVILQPEEGLTSFNKANSANFSGGKKITMKLFGVFTVFEAKKKPEVKSRTSS